ncbi:MAG: tRNA dihydrouridine synthase [Verrucomicrobiota bacterium]
MAYQTPLSIYPPDALILAPLAGYSDQAFRNAARRYGCRYAFTPLAEAGMLVYGTETYHQASLLRAPEESWLGVQLLGAKPSLIKEAVKVLNNGPYDVLDFNMGCPARKVMNRGAGAALCTNRELAKRCLETILHESELAVTAKIRIVDQENPDPTVALAKDLEKLGIEALTIHGRTASQGYRGSVAMGVIRAVREELSIPVIANGGVKDMATAETLRRETGCSRLMIARGAIGSPWIFRQLADGSSPAFSEILDTMSTHVATMLQLYGEERGMRHARKIVAAYLKGTGCSAHFRHETNTLTSWRDFQELVRQIKEEVADA